MPPEGVKETVKSAAESPATSLPVAPSARPGTETVTHWKGTGTSQRASTSPPSLSTDNSEAAAPSKLTKAKGWVLPPPREGLGHTGAPGQNNRAARHRGAVLVVERAVTRTGAGTDKLAARDFHIPVGIYRIATGADGHFAAVDLDEAVLAGIGCARTASAAVTTTTAEVAVLGHLARLGTFGKLRTLTVGPLAAISALGALARRALGLGALRR